MADWHNGYRVWLTESQSLHNAQLGANRLLKQGWNKKSICAVLGNMRHESSVNPNMYEFGYAWGADRGFGLVQWTPRSKYWNWALSKGFKESELRDGEAQMDRIDWEAKNGQQWISTPNYPESFNAFRKNTNNRSLDYLTEAFTWNYERPLASAGYESMPERKAFAKKCYDKLDFSGGSDGGSDGGSNPVLNLMQKALKSFTEFLEDALTWDLHSIGTDKYFSNNYFQMIKTFNNTYQLKMNVPLLNEFDKLIDSIMPDNNGGSDGGSNGGSDGGSDGGSKSGYNTKDLKNHKLNFKYAGSYEEAVNNGYPFPKEHHGNDYAYVYETLKSHVSGTVNGNGQHGFTVNDGGIGYNGDGSGWGNRIVIKLDDGSCRSFMYAHLNRMDVKAGDKIKVGQKIGQTGNTGEQTTGAHLHVELKDAPKSNETDGTIDPTPFIDKHAK